MALRPLRSTVIAFGLAAVAFAACGSAAGVRHANAQAARSRPWRAIVNVSVATLWAHRDHLRRLDAPSAQNPVGIAAWLHGMSTADREWLVGRVQTQALYGMTVYVLRQRGGWSYVGVRGQPSQLNPIGYPGWLPTRQPGAHDPGVLRHPALDHRCLGRVRPGRDARRRVAGDLGERGCPLPGGIRHPEAHRHPDRRDGTAVRGACVPVGRDIRVWLRLLRLHVHDLPSLRDPAPPRCRPPGLARRAGCSADLRPGDLVFFAGPGGTGTIHHVAIFMGAGRVIEAPRTGEAVKMVPLATLMGEYAGARRYL
jgi:gamma-D-glutamyl-L-lysine dipeptidyl-peptidase